MRTDPEAEKHRGISIHSIARFLYIERKTARAYFYCHRFRAGVGCCLILVAFAEAGIHLSPDASDRCETPRYAATPVRLLRRWP